MADLLPQVNVTRIDAAFPEQWREEWYQFMTEMSAIKDSLDVLAVSNEKSAEATNKLAEWYSEGGISPLASQAGISEAASQARVLDQFGQPIFASTPEAVREALGARGAAYGVTAPTTEEAAPQRPAEGSESGYSSTPPNAPPPQRKKRFEDFDAAEYLAQNPIEMPQHYGGTYTAQDLLKLMGQGAQKTNEWWGVGSNAEKLFAKGAELQPTFSAGINIARTYAGKARAASEGLGSYAGSLGYQPGEGTSILGANLNDLNIGPFSFRTPLSSGALSGAGSMVDAYTEAMTVPGLSGKETMSMYQSLAERGWYPGQKGTQNMFDVQSKLYGRGGVFQQLAENPEVMDLVDKATRSGTTSMDDMLRTIEEIPDAAKSAHEGISQMVADMNAYGELSQEQGGTHFAGQQQALQMAAATGLPAAASMGMINSPWASAQIFRETGMPTWTQGVLPGAVKNDASLKAFFQAARTVGRPKSYTIKNAAGGEHVVSGIERQAAEMHKFMYPDMPVEQIMKRLRMGYGPQHKTMEVQQALGDWKHDAMAMLNDPNATLEDQSAELSGRVHSGTGNLGDILGLMGELKTADGRRMFSAHDIGDIRRAGRGETGEDLVQAKYKAVEEILSTKAGKRSDTAGSPGQEVTLTLSPAARKLVQLPNRQAQIKLKANAGSGETINSGYTGATDPIIPGTGGPMTEAPFPYNLSYEE